MLGTSGKTRASPHKYLSRKQRTFALSRAQRQVLLKQAQGTAARVPAAVAASAPGASATQHQQQQQQQQQQHQQLSEEQEQALLLALPKLPRMRRNSRKHLFTTVEDSMVQLNGNRQAFIDAFKFPPEQVITISELLFPAGLDTPSHGRLASEEATLMLLGALHGRHKDISSLARAFDRDPCNSARHFRNLVINLDSRFGQKLFSVQTLAKHAQGRVQAWRDAFHRVFNARFPSAALHSEYDNACLVLEGIRFDLQPFGSFESEVAASGTRAQKRDFLFGALVCPEGLVLALIGPNNARSPATEFCALQLRDKVHEIHCKVVTGDSLYQPCDWLCPLPGMFASGPDVHPRSSARQMPTEWSLSEARNCFRFVFDPHHHKLAQTELTAQRLRVSFLLSNLYVLLNGNSASHYFTGQRLTPKEYIDRAIVAPLT